MGFHGNGQKQGNVKMVRVIHKLVFLLGNNVGTCCCVSNDLSVLKEIQY